MFVIRSKDKTQAVFINKNTDDLFVVNADMNTNADNELFVTDDKDKAYEAWQMAGGDYGDFEIAEM